MALIRTLAVDLDATILTCKRPFESIENFGKGEKKVRECLLFLQKRGFEILIHTTRTNHRIHYDKSPAWLRMNVADALSNRRIPFDEVWIGPGKPLAEFYIDDRAVFYAGDWEETMKEILSRAERSFKNVY